MQRATAWFAIAASLHASGVSSYAGSHTWHGNSSSTIPSVFPLLENADSADLFPMSPCGTFPLEEATIDQMQAAMEAGTLTSQQLVGCYLKRTYQTQEYIQ